MSTVTLLTVTFALVLAAAAVVGLYIAYRDLYR